MSDNYTLFGIKYDKRTDIPGYHSAIELVSNEVGRFYITIEGEEEAKCLNSEQSFKILTMIHELSLAKKPIAFCSESDKVSPMKLNAGRISPLSIQEAIDGFPRNIFQKQDRALLNLYALSSVPGGIINDVSNYTFYAETTDEYFFILHQMTKKNFISCKIMRQKDYMDIQDLHIGEAGWRRIEEIGSKINELHQVFVAMWFDEKMDDTYAEISTVLKGLNFNPLRIDNKEHNNEISGEILYEIQRSRFVIADVTGQRQGVYFEAGYAMGQRIPVIWMCKEKDFKNIHFDTRQYNHIVWESVDDLKDQLHRRIKGTILIDT